MSEKQLEEMSITAMGDRLRLKAFCGKKGADSTAATETEERKKKIEKMKKLLEHQSSSKRSSGQAQTTQQKTKQIKTLLKFEFGWKQWSRSDKAFKQKKKQSKVERGFGKYLKMLLLMTAFELQRIYFSLAAPAQRDHLTRWL